MGRITLWGFYKYNPNLFENCIFPSLGDLNMQIELIMENSGMLFPFHQNPDYLKQNIEAWFNRKYNSFTKMFNALYKDYDPIENYDRKEEWTDTPNVDYTHTGSITDSGTSSDEAHGNSNTDVETKVSAYNTSAYSPNEQSSTTVIASNDSSTTSNNTRTFNNEVTSETGTRKHEGRMHGNIGVTTNQQMIQSELELRKYDIYEVIAKMFEKQFLMQVY